MFTAISHGFDALLVLITPRPIIQARQPVVTELTDIRNLAFVCGVV